ncbi:MAG: G5 domain-containing protein [Lachnoclostridium sp.]|jgi:vancomycin resistance protein YoaR
MVKKKNILMAGMFFAICLFLVGLNTKVMAASDEETITKGVYIDSIHLGGMTKDEARKAVKDYVDNLRKKKITVKIDDNKEEITLKDLDYHYKENDFIDEALQIGKTGNLIKRYKELKDTENSNLVYNLEFSISDEKLEEFLKDKCSAHNIEAQNASVKRENGEFIYTDHKVGRKLNVKKTAEVIKSSLTDGWNQEDIVLEAVVEDDMPKYTLKDVKKCKDKLGTFQTTYASSSANRAGNLANGARLINNTVLYPGDVFSAYDKLTPFTTANGYYEAGAYSNGKLIDSIGGGACQVTTTLYNAVLMAELEVVERHAHSMTISYVDLSRDAAIAGTWKDLKFKNNTDSPVLIEAYTSGRTITFNIWGNETRDTKNRIIKFESVVLKETAPGKDVITKDPTKPTTYSVTTQSAHTGYVAELYKIVYENGVEVSRTRVNKSVYNATPRYITVGTMEVEEETADDENTKTTEPAGEDTSKKDKKTKGGKSKITGKKQEDSDFDTEDTDEEMEEEMETSGDSLLFEDETAQD